MECVQEISLSKIADILSSSNLIIPKVDIWKKILNNSGLSDSYENRSPQFTTLVEHYGYGRNECNLHHNDSCYNALYETFKEIFNERDSLLKLFNSISEKISVQNLFIDNVEKEIKRTTPKIKSMYIDEYINTLELAEKNKLLNQYANKSFQLLRNNCNILELDMCFDENGLGVFAFMSGLRESCFDNSILTQWLNARYHNIAKAYISAIKAYSNGDAVACINHCRSIITGIFTHKKSEQRKWLDGLQKVCNRDKNIENVSANQISSYNYNANSDKHNERYQYPRFNLIYKLYSYTSALGAHTTEGNISDGNVDCENATLEDAFLALRMTEDVLIWLYQTN
jgi:hypothetical protein